MEHGQLSMIRPEVVFYDHQVTGVRSLVNMPSFLLCDDMGLGKSLTALTTMAVDFEVGRATRFMVVATATLKGNWLDEILTHTNFRPMVLDGTPEKRMDQLRAFWKGGWDVLIVNYEQVEFHAEHLNHMHFDAVIYDEAHYLKNREAARTRAVMRLVAPRHMLLTGSPILNQADDLWALLHRIDPVAFRNYWRFRGRYCALGGYKGKQLTGVKNPEELNRKLNTYMVRRLKADTIDLPEKQRIVVKLDLTPEQRALYRQVRDEQILVLPNDPTPVEVENALTRFTYLKQICGTTAAIEGYDDHSTKLDRAVEMITEAVAGGESIVVFTQFRAVQACLARRLGAHNPTSAKSVPHWELNGDVPPEDRVPIVNRWRDATRAGHAGALIAMLQVGGVGLNMTAASKCIFLDKLFAPKLNEQAEDRLHRIGADLTKPIQIWELICRGTIEARIESILRNKEKIFGSVVDGDTFEYKKRLVAALRAEYEEDQVAA